MVDERRVPSAGAAWTARRRTISRRVVMVSVAAVGVAVAAVAGVSAAPAPSGLPSRPATLAADGSAGVSLSALSAVKPRSSAATAADPSGQTMPVGNLAGWHQIVAQNFSTPVALGSFPGPHYKGFFPYSGYSDTSGNGTYNPAKVLSVHGGVLDYYLHTAGGQHDVSSVVVEVPGKNWGQVYGRYSVRFRSDRVPGYKMAFLLWPDDDNWDEGEIDFPETVSLTSAATIYANRYAAGRPVLSGSTLGFKTKTSAAGTGWHTATTEWSPGGITYYLDGKKLGTTTSGVPHTLMRWTLQVETGIDVPAPSASAAGHVQVDWVTMYSRVPPK